MRNWNHIERRNASFFGLVVPLYRNAFWSKLSNPAALTGGLCFELSKRDDSERNVPREADSSSF